jgi:hypothetical protein
MQIGPADAAADLDKHLVRSRVVVGNLLGCNGLPGRSSSMALMIGISQSRGYQLVRSISNPNLERFRSQEFIWHSGFSEGGYLPLYPRPYAD